MVVLSKTRKFQYAHSSKLVSLPCSSWVDIIDTSLQPFTVFNHKLNSSRHNYIMAFEIRYYLIHNKDDIECVTEFPCFLGHPVHKILNIRNIRKIKHAVKN